MKIYKIEVFKNWIHAFKSESEKRLWKHGKRPEKNKNHGNN